MSEMTSPVLHHPNCRNSDCSTCLSDAEELMHYLSNKTGDFKVDHLAHYRTFLEQKEGFCAETEWGWFIPEVFDEENVNSYILFFIKQREGEIDNAK